MQKVTKIAIAVVVVALIAVIGLIVVNSRLDRQTPAAEATAQPTDENGQANGTEPEDADQAGKEAQDEAQGTMYEGALAGLTEEEIAALALAEEEADVDGIGGEDAVD